MTIEVLPNQSAPTLLLDDLLADLRGMIDHARASIASTVNARMTMLYWHLGNRIRKEILNDKRAQYGRTIVARSSGATINRMLWQRILREELTENDPDWGGLP